ncbi:MAG: hypothetical protein ACJ746_19750 [Bryobacteraceae bacterium]
MRASAEACDECKSSSLLWRHVYGLLADEREHEPSMDIVEFVKNAFPEDKPVPWLAKVTDFASIVFDSFLQPTPAGVRSSARSNRQITVESGAFVVDLQLESDTVQRQCSLTGQILANSDSASQIAGAEVVLLDPDKVVQKTRANDLGEFCLDFNYGENLRLFIDIRGERGVGIVLPKLDDTRLEPLQ